MSIYALIDHWVKSERKLFEVAPALGDPIVRRMIVSEPIQKLIEGPWETPEWAHRCGLLRGDIDWFVEGSRLTVAKYPYRGKTSHMLRLDPEVDEIWELRFRDPEQIRIFGRFADKDVFIALVWEFRGDLGMPRKVIEKTRPLTPEDFPDVWRDASIQCKTEWVNFFRPYEPKPGADLHDYLSNAVLV